jgi:macrocin-O-methyltransferase TylF-like protien
VPVLLRRGAYENLLRHITRIEKDVAALRKRVERRGVVVDVGDESFRRLAEEVVSVKRTMLRYDRLWIIWQAVRNVAPLGYAAAEVGAYRGGSSYFIAGAFREALGRDVPVEVIDTFEGHPREKLSEHDDEAHRDAKKFTATNYDDVVDYLSGFERVTVHRGEFSQLAPTLPERHYALVHVDVDLYEPALDCLHYFAPRLVSGGVIILDDYNAPKCPGIRRAAEEYLREHGGFQSWNPHTEQLLLVKSL